MVIDQKRFVEIGVLSTISTFKSYVPIVVKVDTVESEDAGSEFSVSHAQEDKL